MLSPDAEIENRQRALEAVLAGAGRLLVAFSGGVDSSLLAFAAHRVLGDQMLAVTAVSPSYPEAHRIVALQVVTRFRIPHRFVETFEMQRADYRRNAPDRCYHCKSELFETMDRIAEAEGFDALAYGINQDDTRDFRPGHRAAREHAVRAPLLEAGLSKAEIRDLSRRAGLPTADLPASACLSSRLPYGTEVTIERLNQVEEGEARLRDLGFRQLRLRHHGDLARIEIDPSELARAQRPEMTARIVEAIRPLGFREVEVDPSGYRMGSLNEGLAVGSAKSA
ncbi:MAG: ATP-dependent sacrificial sulfur transferase LarE [Myxococcota bacterium]